VKGKEQRWYDDFSDIGYAVGKINMLYLILDSQRRKEFEEIWAKHVEPVKDVDYKVRFIEEGKKYTFIAYGESNSKLVFYKRKLDIITPYSKFKDKIGNDTIFTFCYKRGDNLRLSHRNKTIKDIKIIKKTEISPNSVEWLALEANDEAPIIRG
jgi:hypothetical protein